tara:strand:+ start:1254 stop:1541 length:288 start_codon:yes stop_codon:yes gene_type:complete
MKWRVTGKARSGRWLEEYDDWQLVRMPPRFFDSRQDASHYFETLERAILWKQNPEGSRNQYSVFATLNCQWPEGARADNKVKGIYHKRRQRDNNE